MKQLTRLIRVFLSISLSFNLLQAQDIDVMTKEKMDIIFEHVDKNKIETGLLSDYGCLLIEPYAYNGILTDTNYVTMDIWKALYLSMYTTQINNKISLKEPQEVFDRLNTNSPALLFLQYNRLDEKAVENGLLTIQNGQIHETGSLGSPYLKQYLFAIGLPNIDEYHSPVIFTFQKENYISNQQETPTQLSIRFNSESDYQNIIWGQPISHTFTSYGEKEICIRAKFSNGKVVESHTKIKIISQGPRYDSGDTTIPDTTITIAKTSTHSGGEIQIKYAQFNNYRKLIRPLIIADESDILEFFGKNKMNLQFLLTDVSTHEIMETVNKLYDIVYINNNKGFDDIFRNAQLFEDALERINNIRFNPHDQNCVIGLGMGGLVARYALRDMEQKGKDHDVYKFITINSPHKGINIPLGLQALIRHIQKMKLVKLFIKDISKEASKLCDLLDQTAIKQMLTYSIDKFFEYQNDHTTFMQKYEGIGMPTKCKNIAISNGSFENYSLFKPGDRFFEYNKTLGSNNFLLKLILLGKTELKFNFWANALKSKERTQIYWGNFYLHKKIFFWYKDIDYIKKELYSNEDMVALDGAPGSIISIKQFFNTNEDISNAFKLSNFCFVPTVSALAINNWEDKLSSSLYLNSKDSGFDKLYATSNNNDYTMLETCSDFLSLELAPQIKGENTNIIGETTFTIYNVPDITPIPGYIGIE